MEPRVLVSCNIRERLEHGTEGIGFNLNPRWHLRLMSYPWMIV